MRQKLGPERHNGIADTLVVVPAFNEQNNIVGVLREIQSSLPALTSWVSTIVRMMRLLRLRGILTECA